MHGQLLNISNQFFLVLVHLSSVLKHEMRRINQIQSRRLCVVYSWSCALLYMHC